MGKEDLAVAQPAAQKVGAWNPARERRERGTAFLGECLGKAREQDLACEILLA